MHSNTIAAQQQQQRHHLIAGPVGGSASVSARPEIDREMDRLNAAANTVQALTGELAERLRPVRHDPPPSASGPSEAETPTGTSFGTALRDITRTLEATADGLRYQLSTLAI